LLIALFGGSGSALDQAAEAPTRSEPVMMNCCGPGAPPRLATRTRLGSRRVMSWSWEGRRWPLDKASGLPSRGALLGFVKLKKSQALLTYVITLSRNLLFA